MALTRRLSSGGRPDMAAGVQGDLVAATKNWRTAVAILKIPFENASMTVTILKLLTLVFLSLIVGAVLMTIPPLR
jgi:hypothetical protein